MRLSLFLAVGLTLAGPAIAGLPDFDIEAHCSKAAAGTSDDSVRQNCVELEKAARETLAPHWSVFPTAMIKDCDDMARGDGIGSYRLLGACLANAATGNPPFTPPKP